MTKKRQGNRDNDKKMSPKEKQVLSTFNKLNQLHLTSVDAIDDTSEMEKITDQIENCNKILKYLKQKKQNLISAQNKYFKEIEKEDKSDKDKVENVQTTNLSESFDKDSSDQNSTAPTQLNSNICNQVKMITPSHEHEPNDVKVVRSRKKQKRRSRPVKFLSKEAPEQREMNEDGDDSAYFQGIAGKTYDLGNLVNPKELLKRSKISAADQLLLIYQLTYKGCDSKLGSTDFWREVYKTYRKCFNNLSMASVIRHWYQIRSHGCYNEFVALIYKFKPVLETYDLK